MNLPTKLISIICEILLINNNL